MYLSVDVEGVLSFTHFDFFPLQGCLYCQLSDEILPEYPGEIFRPILFRTENNQNQNCLPEQTSIKAVSLGDPALWICRVTPG